MEQEEPREAETGDEAQLLVQARGRLRVHRVTGRVALGEAVGADARERSVGLGVLGARVAVAEVLGEVEAQRVGEALGLRDGVGMVREAGRHRLRRREHVRVVAAAQRLGGVERRVLADGDEGVLEAGARRRVRVGVAGRDARHAESPRQRLEAAVERPVVAMERALELDPERVGAEDPQQPAHRRFVVHAVTGAAAEADEALGVRLEVVERRPPGCRGSGATVVTGVRVCAREEPGEVRPAGRVADEQGDVAPVGQRDLCPVDRAQADPSGGLRELHRPRDRVMVGERQGGVAAFDRGRHELLGLGGPVQKREGRMAVELDV